MLVDHGAIAELGAIIVLSGPGITVLLHEHGVILACSHAPDGGHHLHQGMPVGRGAVTELSASCGVKHQFPIPKTWSWCCMLWLQTLGFEHYNFHPIGDLHVRPP